MRKQLPGITFVAPEMNSVMSYLMGSFDTTYVICRWWGRKSYPIFHLPLKLKTVKVKSVSNGFCRVLSRRKHLSGETIVNTGKECAVMEICVKSVCGSG